jgi:hypothetical protein
MNILISSVGMQSTSDGKKIWKIKFKIGKIITEGEIHETLQICKSLTKRQIQCFNNVGCHGFEFATSYRALPSFVNDPLSICVFVGNIL